MIRRGVVCVAFLGAAGPLEAHAAPPPIKDAAGTDRHEPVPGHTEKRWYGWQTLAVDGAALGLGILGGVAFSSDSNRVSTVGVLTPLLPSIFGSPLVHYLHGQPRTALASLGLRLGLPAAGALVGAALDDRPPYASKYECGAQSALLGATLAMMATITLDATLLAWEQRRMPARAFAQPGGIALTSTINLSPGFVGMSLHGRI